MASADGLLDLPTGIADRDRPGIEFLLRYVAADLGRAGFKQRSLARNRDLLGGRAHFQHKVERQGLRHRQDDVLANRALEAGRVGAQLVSPRLQIRHTEHAGVGGDDIEFHARGNVNRLNRCAHNNRARWIGHGSIQSAAFALSEQTRGKCQHPQQKLASHDLVFPSTVWLITLIKILSESYTVPRPVSMVVRGLLHVRSCLG